MKGAGYIICFIVLITAIIVTPASAATRYVCAVGCDYTNIQTAIDASSDGDTVFVYNGTYSESANFIYIYKNITLKGEGADVVTIDGKDWNEAGGGTGGIFIGMRNNDPFDVDGAVVEGFKLLNTLTGVMIYPSASNCTVRSNIIDGMSGLWGYNDGSIIYSSSNNFSDNVITNATTAYGTIYLMSPADGSSRADFNTIANNTFINNQLTDDYWAGAIELYNANNSIIINNTFINNAGSGIVLYDSHNNTITKNNLLSNERGMWWQQWEESELSENNIIYLNNFNNTENVVLCEDCIPITNNIWNSTEQMKYLYNSSTYTNYPGNYWSDYTGSDSNGDGIGDEPYAVPNSSDSDFRPLMLKFENYLKPVAPTPKPANASVSLGASIRPAIAIEVTPSSINYGDLASGQTSSGSNLTVKNKGGYSINVTAEVTDNAENLFVDGVLLNESSWNLYSAVIPKSGNNKPVAKLRVPDDYAGVGAKVGTLMFWAQKA